MKRIAIHDFGGHPFTLQLAEALSHNGYKVAYFYTSANDAPNVGQMSGNDSVELIDIQFEKFQKQNFVKRKFQEMAYGKVAVKALREWEPDVLISNTAPVDSQITISKWAKKYSVRHIFWFQDIVAHAAKDILTQKLGFVGGLIASNLARTERRIVQMADFVINISEPFKEQCLEWGVPASKQVIQPNWPVINRLPLRPKINEWSIKQDLQDKFVFLYSGTLGFKQRPELMVQLAEEFVSFKDIRIVIVSSSIGVKWIEEQKEVKSLSNLILFPFQPFEDIPDVMGAADVLVTIQTAEAGKFCVPSKVLSYLCAGRSQLLAINSDNQAALMVHESESGVVVNPDDDKAFLDGAMRLYKEQVPNNARAFAEKSFDINSIVKRFEKILDDR
ncbi:glycosyltransferase family 4 protein [Fibrobacterales bacterium]|nr:glycosyltransferase family 4 protein [Fibrobacterales bacterium]